MKIFFAVFIAGLLALTCAGTSQAAEQTAGATIHIVRGGTIPQSKGLESNFTGKVTVVPPVEEDE